MSRPETVNSNDTASVASFINTAGFTVPGISALSIPAEAIQSASSIDDFTVYLEKTRQEGKHSFRRIPTIREEIAADWQAEQAAEAEARAESRQNPWVSVGPLMIPRCVAEAGMTVLELLTPASNAEWRNLAIALLLLHVIHLLLSCFFPKVS